MAAAGQSAVTRSHRFDARVQPRADSRGLPFQVVEQASAAYFSVRVDEIEALLRQLLAETTRSKLGPDDGLIVAIELGLLEGDVMHTSAGGNTVMLPEPWSVIEARLRVVRDEIAYGASIHEAIEYAKALGRMN